VRFAVSLGALVASLALIALPSIALASSLDATSPVPSVEPTSTTPTPTPEPRTMTLLVAGDLMCHSQQLRAAHGANGYDFKPAFARVAKVVSAADLSIGNLETTLSEHYRTGYPTFKSPASYASALKWAGFDALGTANNHTLDGGGTGVRYTSRVLDRLGLAHVGSDGHRVTVVERNGIRIAVLAYTYGTNGLRSPYPGAVNRTKLTSIRRDIKSARKHADAVIVMMHWGSEYTMTPAASTRRLARGIVRAGADLVVGSHPHVVQPVERYKGHYIVYSMGNFISGQSRSRTDLGIMVRVRIKKGTTTSIDRLEVLPVYRDATPGLGRSSYRTVLISSALAGKERAISRADRRRLLSYRALCRRMFGRYL